jgi:hypothetical protein
MNNGLAIWNVLVKYFFTAKAQGRKDKCKGDEYRFCLFSFTPVKKFPLGVAFRKVFFF